MTNLIGKIFNPKKEQEALVTFTRERINAASVHPCSLELHLAADTPLSTAMAEICTMGHFPQDPELLWEVRVFSRLSGAVIATIRYDKEEGATYQLKVDDFLISPIEELHLEARVARD